jgi:hypothetical protein
LLFEYTGLADEANHFDSRRRYYQKLLKTRVWLASESQP